MKIISKIVRYLTPSFAIALLCLSLGVALGTLPGACTTQTQDTLKADGSSCLKAIPLSTYVQVVQAATSNDWQTELGKLGIQVGEGLVTCAARDIFAILTASKGSGAATSQPEPVVLHLKSYLDSKKAAP